LLLPYCCPLTPSLPAAVTRYLLFRRDKTRKTISIAIE
jgi:hypothetical protein